MLSITSEYLSGLKAQVLELQNKNQALETQLLSEKEDCKELGGGDGGSEREAVEVLDVSQSSSGERRIELRVISREEECDLIDLLIRLFECLRQMQDVSLEFVDADTQMHQMNPPNRAIFTLKIKVLELYLHVYFGYIFWGFFIMEGLALDLCLAFGFNRMGSFG